VLLDADHPEAEPIDEERDEREDPDVKKELAHVFRPVEGAKVPRI
jgi:hypothetical protein